MVDLVGYIYCITNTQNGKLYVGKTSYTNPFRRWNIHKKALKSNKHYNSHLQSAWNLYGSDSFTFMLLETSQNDTLNKLEREWIVKLGSYKSINGYNKTFGGDGMSPNDETRLKMSKVKLGTTLKNSHRNNISRSIKVNHPMLSKNHSEESKNKMSFVKLGKTSGNAKKVKCLNNGIIYKSGLEAAKSLKVPQSKVSKVCLGELKSVKGFIFEFVGEQ